MKYERSAPVRIGHISQINTFVTNQLPSEDLVRICAEHDVAIELSE
jgi:DeoR family glycerol-3-phosphate regulon repressor